MRRRSSNRRSTLVCSPDERRVLSALALPQLCPFACRARVDEST